MLESTILNALQACYDPGNPFGKPANLVELGCVKHVQLALDPEAPGAGIPGVAPRFRLLLNLSPTSGDADARVQLAAQVRNALAGIEQISHTELVLGDDWAPADVTPEGRQRLRLDPAPFAILNNRR